MLYTKQIEILTAEQYKELEKELGATVQYCDLKLIPGVGCARAIVKRPKTEYSNEGIVKYIKMEDAEVYLNYFSHKGKLDPNEYNTKAYNY